MNKPSPQCEAANPGAAPRTRKQAVCRLPASLLGVAACFLIAVHPALAGEGQTVPAGPAQAGSGTTVSQQPAAKLPAVPEGAAGMVVHIDPQTGAILKEPAPGAARLQLSPQLQNALSTSHEGLVEVPNPVPGGGFKLDLQGRFQSAVIATTDANGRVRMQHLEATPKPGDKK